MAKAQERVLPAALFSATICEIVTSSGKPPEPKNAATRSHHGTRDR
jgi:hypothetical protein